MHHAIVYYDPRDWAAVPANNGGSGSIWQWGDEILVGFTRGAFLKAGTGHQCDHERPFESWLARSRDGGESWTAWKPESYAGDLNPATPRKAPGGLDFLRGGFVLRVEGAGYHGNEAARWFYSYDRAASWSGPFEFSGLLEHPELAGAQFTGRTAYIIGGRSNLQLFLTVRERSPQPELRVTLREKAFLARTQDGGASFSFVSWVVPRNDPYRAAMPAPVRLTGSRLVTALRRKSPDRNWIDCFGSSDGGDSWSFLSTVGETEVGKRAQRESAGASPIEGRETVLRLRESLRSADRRPVQQRRRTQLGRFASAARRFPVRQRLSRPGIRAVIPADRRPACGGVLLVQPRDARDARRVHDL